MPKHGHAKSFNKYLGKSCTCLSAKCNTKILALNWFDAKTHLPKILSMPSFWFDDFGTQPIKSLMTDKKAPLKPREKALYLSEGHKQHYRQTHHDST
jgi:hypothetical protein